MGAARRRLAVLIALALPARSFGLDVHTQRLLPGGDRVRREMAHLGSAIAPGATAPINVVTRDESRSPGSQVWSEVEGSGGRSSLEAITRASPDGEASRAIVGRLRPLLHRRARGETLVGGTIAGSIDLVDRIGRRAPWAILTATAVCFRSTTRCSCSRASAKRRSQSTRIARPCGGARRQRPLDHAPGLTLTTVFLAFATSRLLPFQQLGVGLALAVMLDITLVRCVLVPAAVVLLREWNSWWPFGSARAPHASGSRLAPEDAA